MRYLVYLLVCGCVWINVRGLNNGLASKPPMGFNTWNAFGCSINEQTLVQHMDLMVNLGLSGAGYEYFNLDDCWQYFERNINGQLYADPVRFPRGIAWLAEQAHQRGLKLGIYSDAGVRTCAGFPGSLGFEDGDARTFADWQVDYLKYDNCYSPTYNSELQVMERYAVMRDALNATGRHMVYSICEWGEAEPWRWGSQIGHLWRVSTDIGSLWEFVLKSIDRMSGLGMYGGPGGWNDADVLEIGNLFEYYYPFQVNRAHFALWAIFKSPLLIGTDLRRLPKPHLDILTAKEVIQLNQDELGIPGDLIGKQGSQEIYACPLVNGSRGVVLFNRSMIRKGQSSHVAVNITIKWQQLGWPAEFKATVRDLFLEADVGVFENMYTALIEPLDAVALKISPLEQQPSNKYWKPWDHGFFGEKKVSQYAVA